MGVAKGLGLARQLRVADTGGGGGIGEFSAKMAEEISGIAHSREIFLVLLQSSYDSCMIKRFRE